LQGVGNPLVHATRNFSDRVVDYDVYNDLGHLPVETQQDPSDPRPILGGNKDVRSAADGSSKMLTRAVRPVEFLLSL
jgi:hypothetical protein